MNEEETEEPMGIVVDGLYVPPIGLFGIRNMKWGVNKARVQNMALDETNHSI